ncbi:MAG: endonuclease/exonuclease/phosphatase family protein [Planctomycetaceae bacterium]
MLQAIAPLVKFATVCLLLITLATLPPMSRFYLAELCSHFRVQMAMVGLILCLMLCREQTPVFNKIRKVSWRLFAFLPVVIHFAFIVGWYLPGKSFFAAGSGKQPVRLLIANVHTSNSQYEKLVALVEREQPDVIALNEVDLGWLTALKPLHERYPYRLEIPQSDNFGIAIFSRLYIIHNDVFALGKDQPPAIEVAVWSDDNRELTVVAAHTYPPMGNRLMNARNRQLEILGKRMANIDGSRVLVGDFNVSMFSPYYRDLEATTGLENARQEFGILPTWPTRRRVMMIPIDHCLHSGDIEIHDCRVGADIGSDHLPLIVDIAF